MERKGILVWATLSLSLIPLAFLFLFFFLTGGRLQEKKSWRTFLLLEEEEEEEEKEGRFYSILFLPDRKTFLRVLTD